ncbi:MAG TPA: putative baseplate assembly protein [Lacipirellulaceae bacterium]|nr:putative baseplate assembly protein [Lacipirellulaceae bacterium]
MMPAIAPVLDERDARSIFLALVARRFGYVPEWLALDSDAGTALAQIFSRQLETVLRRLNQVPDKNKLAFLDLLAVTMASAQAARAPVVFTLAQGAKDITAPAGTQLSATAPTSGAPPLIFESETSSAVMSASLVRAVSLWPGRDQYADHTAQLNANSPFTLFDPIHLTNVPHSLYIAHDTLLALTGPTTLEVQFELSEPASDSLVIDWTYWDGDIWRAFKDTQPVCSSGSASPSDSTNGLKQNGHYILETECAETAKLTVNGANKFWIRGTLRDPLEPATGTITVLPQVEAIRLSTLVNRPATLSADVQVPLEMATAQEFTARAVAYYTRVRVLNEAGERLAAVTVAVTDVSKKEVNTGVTDGIHDLFFPPGPATISFVLTYQGITKKDLPDVQVAHASTVVITLSVKSLVLDQAFSDGTSLDLTKPFYPFGQQPGPGSTFYFSNQEIFSKPGAKFRLYFSRTRSAQDSIDTDSSIAGDRTPLDPTVSWEYWNGREWSALLVTKDVTLDSSGAVDFTVPDDLEKVKVNDTEALWMRARVVSNSFGFSQTVTWTDSNSNTNRFTFVVVRPPVLSSIGLGYSWRYGPMFPELVFTENFFQFADCTYATIWPGVSFAPFTRVPDTLPALYLGFDRQLPSDSIGLLFDLVEDDDSSERPSLLWEYWASGQWTPLSFSDETRNLGLPGILRFIGEDDAVANSLFGESHFWIRGRLKEDQPPPTPTINRIYTNAVWATQRRTLLNVVLGASLGIANQQFQITDTPVLEGEQIEVRELAGPPANVEWRIIARQLDPSTRLLQTLEKLLNTESSSADVISGPVRLTRDTSHNVTEVWISWQSRDFLYLSGPNDRHYAIDRARGVVQFGDGVTGAIPPAGAQIRAALLRAGGGSAGNVPAGGIAQLLGPLAGVQSVTNPLPAEGGADRESMQQYIARAPQTLRHRNRAITAADYEWLAREASPAIAFARAIPNRNDGGRTVTGWVTLIIIPMSSDPRPYPAYGLREEVQQYLLARMPCDVAGMLRIEVTGPDYLPVDVNATVAPIDATEAGTVEQRLRDAIATFLHPLLGGPEGRGWELGRSVYVSDLAAVVERTEGVDYALDLELLLDRIPQSEQVPVGPGKLVCAGKIEIRMVATERQKALQLSAQGDSLL